MPRPLDRRQFLQTSALAGFGFACASQLSLLRLARSMIASQAFAAEASESPLLEVSGPFVSGVFNGDDVTRPHNILWDRENYIRSKGGRPTSFTTANVAVIGGGMSGLLSAYFLRDQSPVLFEQAPSFGGNSKGEIFQGQAFSTGAAYITVPDAGGEIEALLKKLKLDRRGRLESSEESRVFLKGFGLKNLWAETSAREVEAELIRIFENEYPSIPWTSDSSLSLEAFTALDREDAHAWLRRKFPRLHPLVEEYFQCYCWSSFGGSLEELSAAQFLNFVAAETAGVVAFPGGNSAIGHALYQSLANSLPEGSLRAGTIVLEVKNIDGGVEVLFEDKGGKLRLLRAKAAVMAAPKYVARYITAGISSETDAFWKNLPYRAYVVANVQLKASVPQAAFDIFTLEGKVPEAPTFGRRTDRAFADFVFAGWAGRAANGNVLTLYKPYPFEGARSLLTSDGAFTRIRAELEATLPATLQQLGMPKDSVSGIRLTRWAHSIPLAQTGMASSEDFKKLSQPLGRISFANQDNYMNPAFETAFAAAQEAAASARKAL